LAREAADASARDALALYTRRTVREIDSVTPALGGLDLLVFTAGVGEHNPTLRARICDCLGILGLALDQAANLDNKPKTPSASSPRTRNGTPRRRSALRCSERHGSARNRTGGRPGTFAPGPSRPWDCPSPPRALSRRRAGRSLPAPAGRQAP